MSQQFIKKNGKIVPISAYQKKGMASDKPMKTGHPTRKEGAKPVETKKALAFVGAGVGLSALANFGAGKLLKKGAAVAQTAKPFIKTAKGLQQGAHATNLSAKVQPVLLGAAGKRVKAAGNVLGASKALRFTGQALGGALVGMGISKLHEAITGKKQSTVQQLASTGAGIAVVAVGNYAFKKGVGAPLLRKLLSKIR